ncbi:MAG: hypothetical protein IKU23_00435 [Clostridia bacterium]|nr:hypothetical protein [Clostridia bacterium]
MSLLGALLLTAGAYFGGIIIARSFAEELYAIDGVLELLDYMQTRIESLKTPLYQLFCDCAQPYLESVGFLPMLRSSPAQINSLWQSATELLPLSQAVKKELLLLGESLGDLPLEEQQKRISLCINSLKSQQKNIASSLPKRQKGVRTTALLIGAVISILLI